MARDAPGGILFSGLSEKSMQKRDAGERNSAYAQKYKSSHFTYYRYTGGQGTPLRATVESGFLSARNAAKVVSLAPVEYLTYGSRKRRRVFRPPCRTIPIRIVIAFSAGLKILLHKLTPRKNPRRGHQPSSWSFYRGLQWGKGSRANPAKRFAREKEEQRNGRDFALARKRGM